MGGVHLWEVFTNRGFTVLSLTTIDIPIIVYGGDKEENVKEPF
jgi:hypothetical protein